MPQQGKWEHCLITASCALKPRFPTWPSLTPEVRGAHYFWAGMWVLAVHEAATGMNLWERLEWLFALPHLASTDTMTEQGVDSLPLGGMKFLTAYWASSDATRGGSRRYALLLLGGSWGPHVVSLLTLLGLRTLLVTIGVKALAPNLAFSEYPWVENLWCLERVNPRSLLTWVAQGISIFCDVLLEYSDYV